MDFFRACTECVQVWTSDIYDNLHRVHASLDLRNSDKHKNSRDDVVCSGQDMQSITRHSVRAPVADDVVFILIVFVLPSLFMLTYTILKYVSRVLTSRQSKHLPAQRARTRC